MDYSSEADRLLAEAGAGHLTEAAIAAQTRETALDPHLVEDVVAAVVADEPAVRHHLDYGLTRRQREVLRCARLCRRRARTEGRSLVVVVAEEIGVSRRAAYYMMNRIRERIQARRWRQEPSAWVIRLWADEIKHKQRMIYRRPKRGWISAYLYGRRRARR